MLSAGRQRLLAFVLCSQVVLFQTPSSTEAKWETVSFYQARAQKSGRRRTPTDILYQLLNDCLNEWLSAQVCSSAVWYGGITLPEAYWGWGAPCTESCTYTPSPGQLTIYMDNRVGDGQDYFFATPGEIKQGEVWPWQPCYASLWRE